MKKHKSIIIARLGSFIEFFDFSIYSFSSVILAPVFFPDSAAGIAILKSYGIFAIGNFSRPIGALIFGRLGDKYGRKLALQITVIGISIPTLLIGILPSYNHWGFIAPLILMLCRLIQGIFVGGESDGVAIYIKENTKNKFECFTNSLNRSTSSTGILMGALMVSACSTNSLPTWSWRIPFILAGILGIITFFLRRSIRESDEFLKVSNKSEKHVISSISSIIKNNWLKLLTVIVICGAHGGLYNFYYIFLFNYLGDISKYTITNTTEYWKSISLLIYILFSPITGIIADKVGLVKTLMISVLTGLLFIFILSLLIINNSLNIYWIIITSIWITFILAPGYVLLTKLFDVKERYQCMSFGHSLGSALFSGTAPAIGMYIWYISESNIIAPLYYMFALIILMGIGSLLARKLIYQKRVETLDLPQVKAIS